jgi:PTS system nitrogen regulatory IIA component
MIEITKYLDPKLVTFLDVKTRDDALKTLVDLIYSSGKIEDKEFFYNAILEREKIVSTGIGMGVAIPHAKLSSIDNFFVGVGILQKGIEWDALDGAPVRLIFLIGGPDDKPTEYLQILSTLTNIIKNEEKRKKLLTSNSAKDIIQLFKKG